MVSIYLSSLNIKIIDLLDTVRYFWNVWGTKYETLVDGKVNCIMSRLQELFLDNCKLAVQRYKIDDFHTGYVIMAVTMLSLAPVTVILNGVTIYVFWRENRTRTITDTLLCFLTITDVIGGILAMPLFAAESILLAAGIGSPCSLFLGRQMIGLFSVEITIVTSILIVFDRYCSIFYPYRYDTRKYQTGPSKIVVVSLWFVSMVICLLSTITREKGLGAAFSSSTGIFLVFFSIWIHLRIFVHVRQIQRQIAFERSHFDRNKRQHERWYRIKGTRITAVVLCGMFLCYAQQIVTESLVSSLKKSRPSLIALFWTTALVFSNSIVNPVIYIWQMKWFRNALRKIITKRNVSVTDNAHETEWKTRRNL